MWLLCLGLCVTVLTAPCQGLVTTGLDETDQPQANIEAKDVLLGPKGLISADFTVPLVAALTVLFGLGACMCLSDRKPAQPPEYEGFLRLDS